MKKIKDYFPFAIVVFLLFLVIRYWDPAISLVFMILSAARSLIVGCVIAFIVNILMTKYETLLLKLGRGTVRRGFARVIALVFAYVSIIAIIAVVIGIIAPELVQSVSKLIDAVQTELPDLLKKLQDNKVFGKYANMLLENLPSVENMSANVEKIATFLMNGASGAFGTLVSSATTLVSVVVELLIGLIFSIYILAGKERLARQFEGLIRTYIPKSDKLLKLLLLLGKNFRGYIVAQVTDAVILGTLCALGMTIFQFPYAVMSGVIIAAMALIPIVGAFLGMAICSFFILTVSPMKALLFLIFILILQQIDNNIIYPRVVGNSVDLPGIWVLAAVTMGGGLFGFLGIICSVPVTATAYKLIRDDYYRRKREAKKAENAAKSGTA